jgi:hypothetical protein
LRFLVTEKTLFFQNGYWSGFYVGVSFFSPLKITG